MFNIGYTLASRRFFIIWCNCIINFIVSDNTIYVYIPLPTLPESLQNIDKVAVNPNAIIKNLDFLDYHLKCSFPVRVAKMCNIEQAKNCTSLGGMSPNLSGQQMSMLYQHLLFNSFWTIFSTENIRHYFVEEGRLCLAFLKQTTYVLRIAIHKMISNILPFILF